jgi:tetratricopeptide (TPR) repeat protein
LHARYQRLGNSKDLEEALEYQQKALSLIPKGHPDRALCLQNLAMSFMDRYKGLDNVEDIDQAVRSMQEALNLTPEDHPYRAYSLQNLAQSLGARHNRLGNLTDLEQAVQHQQGALSLTPEGHLDRATYLLGLAISLSDRYQKLQEPKDLDAANRYFSEALSLPTSIPESSWEAALKWASLAEQFQPTSCITAFKAAFRLLPELLWLGHSIPLRHDAVRRLDLATATSTAFQICLTLRKLTTVLEIFEQGLATVFQQTLQLKVDVHRLPPHQAQEFQRLSTQLYTGMFTDPMSVVNDWHTLLKNIRNQPGLEYFLLPRSYKELCKASQAGPIVILNSHKNSCDAIIILDPVLDPVHVSLKVTLGQLESQRTFLKQLLGHCHVRSRGESPSSRLFGKQECFMKKSSAESFEELLIWLWTNIVQPVYQVLASVS